MGAHHRHIKQLVNVYTVILTALFLVIVDTPVLIHEGYSIFSEEHLEIILLTLASTASFFIYRMYRNRLEVMEERYHELTKHVGALNLQTTQIEALFDKILELPENKRSLKRTLESLNDNILAAVNIAWVLTRIIDTRTGKTLTEQLTQRMQEEPATPRLEISNKLLLEEHALASHTVFYSNPKNTYVSAFCVLPQSHINHHQNVVITAALNSIAVLYLVFAHVTSNNTTDKHTE